MISDNDQHFAVKQHPDAFHREPQGAGRRSTVVCANPAHLSADLSLVPGTFIRIMYYTNHGFHASDGGTIQINQSQGIRHPKPQP